MFPKNIVNQVVEIYLIMIFPIFMVMATRFSGTLVSKNGTGYHTVPAKNLCFVLNHHHD